MAAHWLSSLVSTCRRTSRQNSISDRTPVPPCAIGTDRGLEPDDQPRMQFCALVRREIQPQRRSPPPLSTPVRETRQSDSRSGPGRHWSASNINSVLRRFRSFQPGTRGIVRAMLGSSDAFISTSSLRGACLPPRRRDPLLRDNSGVHCFESNVNRQCFGFDARCRDAIHAVHDRCLTRSAAFVLPRLPGLGRHPQHPHPDLSSRHHVQSARAPVILNPASSCIAAARHMAVEKASVEVDNNQPVMRW